MNNKLRISHPCKSIHLFIQPSSIWQFFSPQNSKLQATGNSIYWIFNQNVQTFLCYKSCNIYSFFFFSSAGIILARGEILSDLPNLLKGGNISCKSAEISNK